MRSQPVARTDRGVNCEQEEAGGAAHKAAARRVAAELLALALASA